MEAAKDLLKRAVELDSALKYPEALVCYEQGVQNLLRQMKSTNNTCSYYSMEHCVKYNVMFE